MTKQRVTSASNPLFAHTGAYTDRKGKLNQAKICLSGLKLGKDASQAVQAREELFKLTQLAMGVQREESNACCRLRRGVGHASRRP